MATVTRENIAPLNDKLNVKISKEDYYPAFEKAIKDYTKKANIPGFRKGMVPAGMVKKMYGASIFYDEVIKSVEKEIHNYIATEKPEIFAQPLPIANDLKSLDMNNPGDYEFPFEIGLKPEIAIPDLGKAKVTLNKVKVTDEMVNEEIERLTTRHGVMTDPEAVTSDENVLNLSFTETDAEGNEVENGIKKDNSLLVKYFTEEYRKQLMGKKKDDTIIVQLSKAFDEKEREWLISDLGLDKNDTAAADKHFKLTITKVGLIEKRAMSEEFYNEAFPGSDLKTEEDFRNKVKEEIQKYWDAQSKAQLHDQVYHILLDTPVSFPDEFLKRWLQRTSEKEKTMEDIEHEFPSFTNQLKWTLITDKLSKDNKLEVGQEELREQMKKEILQYFGQMNMGSELAWMDNYIDKIMKDEKQVEQTYHRLITEKIFDWASSQVKPEEKEVTPEQLNGMQHHHSH